MDKDRLLQLAAKRAGEIRALGHEDETLAVIADKACAEVTSLAVDLKRITTSPRGQPSAELDQFNAVLELYAALERAVAEWMAYAALLPAATRWEIWARHFHDGAGRDSAFSCCPGDCPGVTP